MCCANLQPCGFNSQPPEGGWGRRVDDAAAWFEFQLTAARRRLVGCRCIGDALGRFQLTAARRRLARSFLHRKKNILFQLTAARRRLVAQLIGAQTPWQFQLTAARRRLGDDGPANSVCGQVSTHSRPKAAGAAGRLRSFDDGGFNSQPPEGGWWLKQLACVVRWCFNSQPPEGGWPRWRLQPCKRAWFQLTAARRRLGTR